VRVDADGNGVARAEARHADARLLQRVERYRAPAVRAVGETRGLARAVLCPGERLSGRRLITGAMLTCRSGTRAETALMNPAYRLLKVVGAGGFSEPPPTLLLVKSACTPAVASTGGVGPAGGVGSTATSSLYSYQ